MSSTGPSRRWIRPGRDRLPTCATRWSKRGASVTSYDSVATALEGQCAQATSDDEILLFGSFYCVAEALEWLARRSTEEAANGIAG